MATKKLHDIDVDAYLADTVTVYPEALEEEFVRLPADLAYWSQRYSDAVRDFLTAKLALDRGEAALRIACRTDLETRASKVTESMVESAVTQHPEMDRLRIAYIATEVEKVRLGGVLDAIRSKRDMLISIGAHVRAEMGHDPTLREMVRGRVLVGSGGSQPK